MRLCVLHPSSRSSAPYAALDPVRDPSRWLPGHEIHHEIVEKATAVRQVRDRVAEGFDAFLNLCDGAWDEDRPGVEVVQALERLGAAFTGAGSAFYDPTREKMKRVCRYWDVPTPEGVFIGPGDPIPDSLRFPLIVKHANSYNSVGLTAASRVTDAASLAREIARMRAVHPDLLVEEFVDGREVTVLVSENAADPLRPHTYVPVECVFPPGETFKHFDLKWKDYQGLSWRPLADEALSARIRDLAARMFTGLGGTGYGRCDVRVDAEGTPYFLEINPNCSVFYAPETPGSADVILSLDPAGHAGFLERLLAAALARRDRAVPAAAVRWRPGIGHDVVASRDLPAGTVIFAHEERPQPIVSRRRIATWVGRKQAWFGAYCWPLGEDVFGMWSDDPDDWRPIDHSCDPSAWMDGLDVVARRDVRRGEPITLDYATFGGDEMTEFQCRCGAAACRGVIRGGDALLPDIVARYGDHASPWVLAWRRRGP